MSSDSNRSLVGGSMRDELLALFSNTERLSPGGIVTPDGPVVAGGRIAFPPARKKEGAPSATRIGDPASMTAREPSIYLRRHLRRFAGQHGSTPSGLDSLDQSLGGGLTPGLHLVLGPAQSGKSAFLLTLAWQAVSERRPVLLYSPREGTQAVWECLIATTAIVQGDPPLCLDTLRAAGPDEADLGRLTRLDAALQESVLPYLRLEGSLPADGDGPAAFIQQVREHAQDAAERHACPPLLLLDDLETLLVHTGTLSAGQVLAHLDRALAAESIAAVATATSTTPSTWDPRNLQVRTVMSLRFIPGVIGSASREERSKEGRQCDANVAQVDVNILANATTGQTDAFPLLLDLAAGLFVDLARPRTLPSARAWSPSR